MPTFVNTVTKEPIKMRPNELELLKRLPAGGGAAPNLNDLANQADAYFSKKHTNVSFLVDYLGFERTDNSFSSLTVLISFIRKVLENPSSSNEKKTKHQLSPDLIKACLRAVERRTKKSVELNQSNQANSNSKANYPVNNATAVVPAEGGRVNVLFKEGWYEGTIESINSTSSSTGAKSFSLGIAFDDGKKRNIPYPDQGVELIQSKSRSPPSTHVHTEKDEMNQFELLWPDLINKGWKHDFADSGKYKVYFGPDVSQESNGIRYFGTIKEVLAYCAQNGFKGGSIDAHVSEGILGGRPSQNAVNTESSSGGNNKKNTAVTITPDGSTCDGVGEKASNHVGMNIKSSKESVLDRFIHYMKMPGNAIDPHDTWVTVLRKFHDIYLDNKKNYMKDVWKGLELIHIIGRAPKAGGVQGYDYFTEEELMQLAEKQLGWKGRALTSSRRTRAIATPSAKDSSLSDNKIASKRKSIDPSSQPKRVKHSPNDDGGAPVHDLMLPGSRIQAAVRIGLARDRSHDTRTIPISTGEVSTLRAEPPASDYKKLYEELKKDHEELKEKHQDLIAKYQQKRDYKEMAKILNEKSEQLKNELKIERVKKKNLSLEDQAGIQNDDGPKQDDAIKIMELNYRLSMIKSALKMLSADDLTKGSRNKWNFIAISIQLCDNQAGIKNDDGPKQDDAKKITELDHRLSMIKSALEILSAEDLTEGSRNEWNFIAISIQLCDDNFAKV